MGHQFQSAETYGTSISECGNECGIHFRMRKRMGHRFPLAETTFPLAETTFPLAETTFPLAETTFPLSKF